MSHHALPRRHFLAATASTTAAAYGASAVYAAANTAAPAADPAASEQGGQRLPVEQLQKWEALQHGMFIHYGLATFVQNEFPSGKEPATLYAPDRLDVDQWVSVARDAGMKYIVLTAKHVAGHCLWPSAHTDYTVANSTDKTNVVEKLCQACEKRGVLPGLYYNSSSDFSENRAWPSDLVSMERNLPPKGFSKWRTVRGKKCYMPGEVCDPIGKNWFWVAGDAPRSDETLVNLFDSCRKGGANLLLNVPADKHGLIPEESVKALMRLRKNAGI